jgi:SAM-dependent methyltransferase
VPISYSGRTYAEGKKITWRDGVRALITIAWASCINTRFTTHDGFYVLTAVRGPKLNQWMYQQFHNFVSGDVLEAGCGIGNITSVMLDKNSLLCADIDPLYVQSISQRFGHLENINCMQMDVACDEDFDRVGQSSRDTVVCLNVLEHIEDDEQTLRNFFRVLRPGGHAILLVPQNPALYTPVDVAVGHYRRYTRSELLQKLERAGFEIVHSQDFNRFATFGWWFNGKVMRRDTISPKSMQLFNLLSPVAKLIEKVDFLPGLSIIAVGRKPLSHKPSQSVAGEPGVVRGTLAAASTN